MTDIDIFNRRRAARRRARQEQQYREERNSALLSLAGVSGMILGVWKLAVMAWR